MKKLKNINKGFILTVLVLIVLVTYLVQVEMKRKSEKPNILKACNEYVEIINKYSVLPEKNQKDGNKITEEEYNKYLKEIEEELKKYIIDNEIVLDIQMKLIKEKLDVAINNAITTKYDREVIKIKKYAFDGDQVTVTVNCKINKEAINDDETKNEKSNIIDCEMVLKNENNTWKIVHSTIQEYDGQSIYMTKMGDE